LYERIVFESVLMLFTTENYLN